MAKLYVLYLDRDHLGDKLFLQSLAQHFSRAPAGKPLCLLVHGSGEKVERTLEAQGLFPERIHGVLNVSGADEVRLVERAVRETNKELVGLLTDEVVSAVGIQGVDRNLLRLDPEGRVQAPRVGWVDALLKQRVVPVVSALVEHPEEGRIREVWAADAAAALAQALEDAFTPCVVFFTKTDRPGLMAATGVRDRADLEAVTEADVPDPDAVRRVVATGVPVLITSLGGLFGEEGPSGTQMGPEPRRGRP